MNDEAATRGPVEALPDSAWLPDHTPDATQLDASVELQVSVDACPEPTVVGLALNVTLGAATGWLTLTETVRATLPPVPAQVSVKSVGAPRALLDSLPLTGLLPVQPPEAVQVDASAALQTRFVGCPLATSDGVAVRLTNGVGGSARVRSRAVTGAAAGGGEEGAGERCSQGSHGRLFSTKSLS